MEIIQTPVKQNKLTRLEKERLEREEAEERARQEREEKLQLQDHLNKMVKLLMAEGKSREEISELSGVPLDQIPIQ